MSVHRGLKRVAEASGTAAAVVGVAALTACGSSGGAETPQTVRITDAHVANSSVASRFISDLYTASHGNYWRTKGQAQLVDIAGIYCVERKGPTGKSDLQGDFTGLSAAGVDEYVSITLKDICVYVDKPGHKIPGYLTG